MIRTEHASKAYPTRGPSTGLALEDVSLSVSPGEFVALTGPSGSGKSTLLSLLGALTRPTQGTVFHDQRNLANCSDVELVRVRRTLGFVFQSSSLLPRLTVLENVECPLIPRGVSRGERKRQAVEVLDRLGLADKKFRWPDELSGGEQQRVAAARALVGSPQIILADEPTSSLDAGSAELLRHEFQLQNQAGVTVIVATHDAELIAVATMVCELSGGRLQCR